MQSNNRHVRTVVYFWSIVVIGGGMLSSAFGAAVEAQQPTATITMLRGQAQITRQGDPVTPVAVGVVLQAGDIIQTHADSTVELTLSDGSTLEVGAETVLDLAILAEDAATGARVSRLKLAWGRVRSILSPAHQTAGSAFTFETPNALAGVKFSTPHSEMIYLAKQNISIFLAHQFGATMTHQLTKESVEIEEGRIGIASKDTLYTLLLNPIIHFEQDRVYLNRDEQRILDGFGAFLKGAPEVNLLLEGHADATGGETMNRLLAQRRAENVKYYLVTRHGIAERRFTLAAHGSTQPIASNETEEGRALNRRVTITWDVIETLKKFMP